MKPHYHRLVSIVLGIAFLITVQLFATPEPIFRYLLPAVGTYLGIMGIYNFLYINSLGTFDWWIWLRPLLLIAAWFGMFLLLPNDFFRGMYLLIGIPLLYFVEVNVSGIGEQVMFNEVVVSAFGFCMITTASAQYFPRLQLLDSVFLFLILTLLCRISFQFTPIPGAGKWIASLILGLFCTEFFWALSFLPLHFSATAVILFNLFYFCWSVFYYRVFNHLTAKKLQFHLALAIAFTVIIIIVTPWKVLI